MLIVITLYLCVMYAMEDSCGSPSFRGGMTDYIYIYMCVCVCVFFIWISEQTVTFAVYIINRLVSITEVDGVYCAVLTVLMHGDQKVSVHVMSTVQTKIFYTVLMT
jgi:hypothetical protein